LMNFEEALRAELGTLTELSNKVFPLNADEGTKAPYVVYISSEGVQVKTLQGYMGNKEVDCEINILHDSYANMKALTKEVLAKIISFQGRSIGDLFSKDGPFIQNVTYSKPVEIYEKEVSLYRSVIDITVKI
jgi:hypothetical protein